MRYLPFTAQDRTDMLAKIGVAHVDELYRDVPREVLRTTPVDLSSHATELAVERELTGLARQNTVAGEVPFFIGAGAYRHHVPATVDYLIQRGEFLTAYTPYQPEISQGTLQALFEFQTQVAQVTGMDVANASLYDGSTGCGEAVLMARRITRRKKAVLSGGLHPQYRDVVKTVTSFTDDEIILNPASPDGGEDLIGQIDDQTSCVVVQYPDFFGHINDFTALAAAAHEKKVLLVVVVTEIVALGALKSPGEMGADIVVGEGQSIGNSLNFGGPYLGLFATKQQYVRQMPGRLCGETTDGDGRRGFVLTLSTREQHIRREKATSNICTNSGLCSLAFTIHMSLLGEKGFRQLAALNHARAVQLAERLEKIEGVELLNSAFFNEYTLRLSKPAAEVVKKLAAKDILAGVPVSRLYPNDEAVENLLVLAVTETVQDKDMDALVSALKEVLS